MSKNRYVKKSAKKIFTRENILTVPNLFTLFRLILVPFIVYFYAGKQDYVLSGCLIALSGITDIMDGFIARKFNMVSDLGKIIDPLADKLTQAAIIVCLATRYRFLLILFVLFALKEVLQAFCGYLVLSRKNCVNSAKWYGKLSTVILYAVMLVLVFFSDIPVAVVSVLSVLCAAVLILALILYVRYFLMLLFEEKASEKDIIGNVATSDTEKYVEKMREKFGK